MALKAVKCLIFLGPKCQIRLCIRQSAFSSLLQVVDGVVMGAMSPEGEKYLKHWNRACAKSMTWRGCSIYLSDISSNGHRNLACSDTLIHLSLQMFALLCDHNPRTGGNLCIKLTSAHAHQHIWRTVIALPFSLLWEIRIFLMHRVGSCVRIFIRHTEWQHRSRPYGVIFGKSLQSQVPCMT